MGRTGGSNKGEKLIRVFGRVSLPNAQVFHGGGEACCARGIFRNARFSFARYKSARTVDGHRPSRREEGEKGRS